LQFKEKLLITSLFHYGFISILFSLHFYYQPRNISSEVQAIRIIIYMLTSLLSNYLLRSI